jgi:N-acyl-D-amino-acid deacylase
VNLPILRPFLRRGALHSALSVLVVLTFAAPGSAEDDAWEFVHGQSVDGFQTEFDRLTKDDYLPLTLHADDVEGQPQFNALFVKDGRQANWVTRHVQSPNEFEKENKELTERGFRIIAFTVFHLDGKLRFGAVWTQDGGRRPWSIQTEIPVDSSESSFRWSNHSALILSTYRNGDGLFRARVDGDFQNKNPEKGTPSFDLVEAASQVRSSSSDTSQFVREMRGAGMRPVSISCDHDPLSPRFDVVCVRDRAAGKLRFRITPDQLAAEIETERKDGFRPRTASLYTSEGRRQYGVIWEKLPGDLPVSGAAQAKLAPFDKAMQSHLRKNHVRGGVLAVSKNGRLALSRGYGFLDAEERAPMPADAMLRVASVTKPVTAMAIRKLIRDGKLTADTKVFDFLQLQPAEGKTVDPRWKDVTVDHLLRHRGGWDSKAEQEGYPDGFDPMFHLLMIGKELGVSPPLPPQRVVHYMAGQPLQFDPGLKSAYSNFGYCVLGRVIEKASGIPYAEYVTKELCEPLGARDVILGRTLPKDRDPREPVYACDGEATDVVTGSDIPVRWPDGGFLLEVMDSHGGIVASAPDLLKLFDAYNIDGTPRSKDEPYSRGGHFGSLPGTFSIAFQRKDGVNFVAIVNQRNDEKHSKKDDHLLKLLEEAADSIKDWPE